MLVPLIVAFNNSSNDPVTRQRGPSMSLKQELRAKLGLAVSDAWLQQCMAFLAAQDPGFPTCELLRQIPIVFAQLLHSDLYVASDGSLPDLTVRLINGCDRHRCFIKGFD